MCQFCICRLNGSCRIENVPESLDKVKGSLYIRVLIEQYPASIGLVPGPIVGRFIKEVPTSGQELFSSVPTPCCNAVYSSPQDIGVGDPPRSFTISIAVTLSMTLILVPLNPPGYLSAYPWCKNYGSRHHNTPILLAKIVSLHLATAGR
tara:strand:+ start:981 stop:1427 length:447 start_codon:yes stop_codon:yes gene_type:complete